MTASSVVLAGRYRLDGRIAIGGVGEVWRATDTALARLVAVKLLRPEYAQHQETLARFQAEARHAGALSHPGIARVYDYGEEAPPCSPYLVMELVEGTSLAHVLARGQLSPARSMHVIAQAAAGLAAAHAARLVHRDIKPANLLITPAGQVKITDFGIAHAAGAAPLTRTGALVGTPAYLAPERVAGASGTPAADLYALGVVAWECLTGSPPFSGDPLAACLAGALAAAERISLGHWARLVPPVVAPPAALSPVVAPPARSLPAAPPSRAPAGQRSARRAWPARVVVLAMAAAVLAAGLAGWVQGGLADGRPPAGPAAAAPGSSHRAGGGGSAGGTVVVNGARLTGKPVAAVRQRLRRLGLQVRVHWRQEPWRPAGLVIAMHPTGTLPDHGVVVLTATIRAAGAGQAGPASPGAHEAVTAGPGRERPGRGRGHGPGDGG